jgi:hypothetical protein
MRPWKVVSLVALGALALLLAGLVSCLIPYEWRDALALEVETPDGLKTGRAVVSLSHTVETVIPGIPGGAVHTSLRGEAAVVEVAPGKYLFALLTGREDLAVKAFPEVVRNRTFKQFARAFRDLREKRDLPTELIPMLVTFRDIADPKSVEHVDPNNLAAAFGPGVTLKRATLEITDEPITTGIEKRIGWMAWSSSKWIEFASDGFEPMRIRNSNGTVTSIPRLEFKRGN